ncbi:MAG TPA: twin-arginine translocase TatA/TatE family subunit [Solirubrobacteraceae bacterium]|nr:twin-arginine translocase TatA/TatE family subunit [Solirubrobacteraceae bacterium]
MLGLENPLHILIVLLVVLLVFGAKRLPELGRSLGSGMREFKDSLSPGAAETPAAEPPRMAEATRQPEAPAQTPDAH